MADEVRLIDANSLLKGIEELKESPWFKRGKLEETDTNVDYNRSLFHIGYLERKEAIEIIIDLCIKKEPTVEAQPVQHGRWIPQGDDLWLCSNCKENIIYSMHKTDRTEKQRYCCRCGARMDGDIE